jgi:hypothetical protein
MLDRAVSAAFAFEQKRFHWIFKQLHQKPAGGPSTKPTSHQPKGRSERCFAIEESIMNCL